MWADLDDCHPDKLGKFGEPLPNILVHTSKTHWQAYWLLGEELLPADYEMLNRRIALGYAKEGCDQGGWDITQLLRVPLTYNHKKEKPWYIEYEVRDSSPSLYMDFHLRLPLLPSEFEIAKITGDMSYLRSLKSMTLAERLLWEKEVPEGERSEQVFRLIRMLKENFGFGDGLVLRELMEHPVLTDKFPSPKGRKQDIVRCLKKVKW